LNKNSHVLERQKAIDVHFQGQKVGRHVLDLIVDERVILELKAVAEIAPIHKQQALSYLKATGLELAIIINFGAKQLQVARVVNTRHKRKNRVIRSFCVFRVDSLGDHR
jgi:GxxExxY protein